MPFPSQPCSARDFSQRPEAGHKKRKQISEFSTDRSKRSCSERSHNTRGDRSEPMERENSRHDFSFLACTDTRPCEQQRNDPAPNYRAIVRYVTEPIKYDHRRTGVERDTSYARFPYPKILLEGSQHGQQQQQQWNAPMMEGSLAGVGSWAAENWAKKDYLQ